MVDGKRKRTVLCVLRESVPMLGSADDRFLETRKSGTVYGRGNVHACMRACESVAPRHAGLCGAKTLWETGRRDSVSKNSRLEYCEKSVFLR